MGSIFGNKFEEEESAQRRDEETARLRREEQTYSNPLIPQWRFLKGFVGTMKGFRTSGVIEYHCNSGCSHDYLDCCTRTSSWRLQWGCDSYRHPQQQAPPSYQQIFQCPESQVEARDQAWALWVDSRDHTGRDQGSSQTNSCRIDLIQISLNLAVFPGSRCNEA